jgi:citrate lyase subunit beta/citryl-CoA lyase
MLAKAAELPADEVVVDLEDGCPAAEKEAARANIAGARARGTLAVRINGVDTRWWRDDLATIAAAGNVDVVVLPKAGSADAVAATAALLPKGVGLEVQIETARGLVECERIAATGDVPLEALVFGPGDFAASIGVPVLTIGDGSLDYALARISVAAHAFGLQAVDGPHAALGERDTLRASAERALAHGYDGKWVVHPDQIEPVNGVFTPNPEEVARAEKILAAADGASLVDGEMVDAATKRLAEVTLLRWASRG